MKKVTGIGGVFFKAKDTAATQAWYEQHLGLKKTPMGSVVFGWRTYDQPDTKACTIWAPFKESTDYFGASNDFMINYRVDNLEALLEELKAAGVETAGDMQVYDYGKFGWIIDPEGRKIELWEPTGNTFENMYQDHTIY